MDKATRWDLKKFPELKVSPRSVLGHVLRPVQDASGSII
jgi:hypothetical protein